MKISILLHKGNYSEIANLPPVNIHKGSHASKKTYTVGLKINTKGKRQHHVGTTISDITSGNQ